MKRRDFIALAGAAAAFPRLAFAQQLAKVPHVAWFSRPLAAGNPMLNALQTGLAALGFVNGTEIIIDSYIASTDADLPNYAAMIVATSPAVIVVQSTSPALAARAATPTIPIVAINIADPIGGGLVSNLAHPAGNLTGTAIEGPSIVGKQVALLKELAPLASRFAVPVYRADPITASLQPAVQQAAEQLSLEPIFVDMVQATQARDFAAQYERVFSAAPAGLQLPYGETSPFTDVLFDLYLSRKFPVLDAGLLRPGTATPITSVVSCAADELGMTRTQVAAMVAEILKGTRPSDVPFYEAAVFDIGVNLDMAKKIGVTIPLDILAQATLVIDYDIRAPQPGAPK